MNAMRDEDGFTLIELMVAMVLGLIMLGAVLTVFESFIRHNRSTELRADAQERARVVTDDLARNLKNAGRSGGRGWRHPVRPHRPVRPHLPHLRPQPGRRQHQRPPRVRYCLDASNPASARFLRQTQTWTTAAVPAAPTDVACPGTGWTSTVELTRGMTNQRNGLNRRSGRSRRRPTARRPR
jgi:prepilin-type N-terminal cleavage/methylation domain-containing protein